MKKTTLIFVLLLAFNFGYAQQTISFEAAEGYNLGSLNNQNGWDITSCGPGCYIDNQVVNDEMSTDGSYSLKIEQDTNYGPQDVIMGGFYTYGVPVPYTTAVFSYDIYISELGASNFRFGIANQTAGFFIAIFEFDYSGTIYVLDDVGGGTIDGVDISFSWSPLTWYNVRIEITGTTITYFIDDVQVYQGVVAYAGDIEEARFTHDNWGGYAYIDNFKTNDENLSIEDNNLNNPRIVGLSKRIGLYNLANASEYIVYNLTGQKVLNGTISNHEHIIDASSLSTGLYVVELNDAESQAVLRKKVVLQ